jgi:hypothetical protein
MVHVTERAKEALLRRKLLANVISSDVGLRLAVGWGGQLGLVADRMKAGDLVVTHKNSTVLLIDPKVSTLVVTGRIIDCRRTSDGWDELVLTPADIEGSAPATKGA